MKRFKQLMRLIHIYGVMARYGVDKMLCFIPFLRFLWYLNPWHWFRSQKPYARGEALRLALEALGPLFVKFGQILSIRYDLLPSDMIIELQKLQDRVSPFPSDQAIQQIEKALKQSIQQVFAEFDPIPIASASIAQVHAAKLKNGKNVVVKVKRPNIDRLIRRDLDLLYGIAHAAEKYWSQTKRFRPKELVAEFEHTLQEEQNFMAEAANASQLRRNFFDSSLLYVPKIFWEYTTASTIVMERISGIPVSDRDRLMAAGIDLKILAQRGVDIFFTQVFRDSFFHADMHPGNIFVSESSGAEPQYIAVDFGIMGSLSPVDQYYLAENLLAFFHRDYRRVAVLHVESGWIPADTRVERFESAIRSVCEPIFEKPLGEISFAQLLLNLFQTASRFHMEVQPQLLLLQKTLFHIEGLGRRLYPELDLWATGKPYLKRWLKQRYGLKTQWRRLAQQLPRLSEKITNLPILLHDVLEYQKKQQLQHAWQIQRKQ